MFRRLAVSLALAAFVAAASMNSAQAAIGDGALGARVGFAQGAPIEPAQFIYGGQNYCWYPNGWRGPGFYWCGYAWRSGYGWGGGYGWHGWGGGYAAGWRGYGYRGGVYRGYGYHGGVYRGYGYHGGVYRGGAYRGGVYRGGGGYHGGGGRWRR
jgi:hypothetical protein